jgi:hypothetical protein
MSGVVMALGTCIACGTLFHFNPHTVPSTRVFTGDREPICSRCFDQVNELRVARGQEPFPRAADAYAAIPEAEL